MDLKDMTQAERLEQYREAFFSESANGATPEELWDLMEQYLMIENLAGYTRGVKEMIKVINLHDEYKRATVYVGDQA